MRKVFRYMSRTMIAIALPAAALYVIMLDRITLALAIIGVCATMLWLSHIMDG